MIQIKSMEEGSMRKIIFIIIMAVTIYIGIMSAFISYIIQSIRFVQSIEKIQ